jgi:hypothetical protein
MSELATIHRYHLPNAETINAALLQRFLQIKGDAQVRRTHHFHGRFENTYIDLQMIPELQAVAEAAQAQAQQILGRGQPLRFGFWFNEMGPGHCTSLHDHDENDELLSACYYIRVPPNSGCFVAVEGEQRERIQPQEGLLLLFSPRLLHEVEENQSDEVRLSVAFNFGPAD